MWNKSEEERKVFASSPLLPPWPQFVPGFPLTGKGREGTGGPVYPHNTARCTAVYPHNTAHCTLHSCTHKYMPFALQYLSLQCIFCSLAEQEATVLVKARCVQCWVTLAPTTSHPTANVVSQGKAPYSPRSV